MPAAANEEHGAHAVAGDVSKLAEDVAAPEHGDALPPDMPAAGNEERGAHAAAGDVSKLAEDVAATSSGDLEDEDIPFILDTLARRIAKDGAPLSCDTREKFSTAIDRVLRRFDAA